MRPEEYQKILDELDSCKNPLFFFHDDADGISSFLLLYRYKREGNAVMVKSKPLVDSKFLNRVEEYKPDKIFVLDLAHIDEEFAEKCGCPIVWIDHHEPGRIPGAVIINPQKFDEQEPTSAICYHAVKQDLWIAMAGMVGDWYLPPFVDRFYELYPDLMASSVRGPDDALFETKIGEIARIIAFMAKGTTSDAMKCIKYFVQLESPEELLEGKSPAAKHIMKKYAKLNEEYQKVLSAAKKCRRKDNILLLFRYEEQTTSFTGELSNELLHLYPEHLIIIARRKSGEMRCSLRSSGALKVRPILEKALVGLSGYGGGHEHACGASVKEEDFEEFIDRMKRGAEGKKI